MTLCHGISKQHFTDFCENWISRWLQEAANQSEVRSVNKDIFLSINVKDKLKKKNKMLSILPVTATNIVQKQIVNVRINVPVSIWDF